MRQNKENFFTIICGLLAFALPAIMICFVYRVFGIYDGGAQNILILDLKTQQISFFNYFINSSYGYNSFEYQTLGGLGGNATNPLQMCCGVFSYFFSSLNVSEIPNVIFGLIVSLIGFSGLFEYIYLKSGFPSVGNCLVALLFSAFYALSSCVIVFTLVPVWLCGTALLPLVIRGVDRIIDASKGETFVIFASAAIILNYYTAYMIAVFSMIYFVYRLTLCDHKIIRIKKLFLDFMLYGFISVCISSFSWMPIVLDLAKGKLQENRRIEFGLIRNPFSVFLSFLPIRYDGLNKYSMPFLYCGSIVFLFFVLYFINSHVGKKEKITSGLVFLFFVLSLSVGVFDVSWMFFSEPNGYPSRYSFIVSFFVILIAVRCVQIFISQITKKRILFVLLTFLAVFSSLELFANSLFLIRSFNDDVGPYADSGEFFEVTDTMECIIDSISDPADMKRIVKNWRYTNNDGVLFGYRDIDYSSSGYNYNFHNFMEKLGMNGQYHLLRSTGLTPIVASVLGVSHYIQYGSSLDDNYSYIGSCNGLDVYYNDDALPLAFPVIGEHSGQNKQFSDNPFENINAFVYDLCGIDGVFSETPVEIEGNGFTVFAEDGKQLWMYAIPSNVISADIHGSGSPSYNVYYDGAPLCEYANSISPYCVELGIGNGDNVSFSFGENDLPQNVYAATYDPEKANAAIELLRQNAAERVFASENGIDIVIQKETDGDVIITLPYENGYEILVDGHSTSYSEYRDALIRLTLKEGKHNIRIRYRAPGVRIGLIITLFSAFFCVSVVCFRSIKRKVK